MIPRILGSRVVLTAEPAAAPTRAVVICHALTMTALSMFRCVRAHRFAQAGILAVLVPSQIPTHWETFDGSPDQRFITLDLPMAMRQAYPSLVDIDAAGFSDGGHALAAALLTEGLSQYSSVTQICSTHAVQQGLQPGPDLGGKAVNIYLGNDDPLVPPTGNVRALGIDAWKALLPTAKVTVTRYDNCGHCWMGGVGFEAPAWLGPWDMTDDATGNLIKAPTVGTEAA
jgi:hypothetical protein